MTIRAIVFATSSPVSGAVALLVAVVVASRGRSLIPVALCAAASVLVTEAFMGLI
ncbi:MAG: hypothetical protein WBL05_00960 [Brooklawnia sp.]|uniref:hypothetical protein n=1 Tax=Brooklawnia sp. TaxID=2699740 RepID=UPI003C7130BC